MQPLFSSAFRCTVSKIYAVKDDEKGHIINHEIHHLSQEPDGRGPTELLTLYLPTPAIAPRSLADLPSSAGQARACEVSAGTEHTCSSRRTGLSCWNHSPTATWATTAAKELATVPARLRLAAGDAGPCRCSSSGEPSLTRFIPNKTS